MRNVIHTEAGNRGACIRVSNQLGTTPLETDATAVTAQESTDPKNPNSAAGTTRSISFYGATYPTVPAGQDAVSDPVPVRVPSDINLPGSRYTPHDSVPATYHRSALQTSFLAPAGDPTPEQISTATTGSWYYGVDVLGSRTAGSVVAQGDSITDGYGSTMSANHGRLTTRLRQLPRTSASAC